MEKILWVFNLEALFCLPWQSEFSSSFSVSWFQDVCSAILAAREFPCSEVQPLLVRSHNICSSVFLLSWDAVIILFLFVWAWYTEKKNDPVIIHFVYMPLCMQKSFIATGNSMNIWTKFFSVIYWFFTYGLFVVYLWI